MPALGWTWSSAAAAAANPDCLSLKEGASARNLMKFLVSLLKVEYVADESVPAEEKYARKGTWPTQQAADGLKFAARSLTPPHQTRELGRPIVQRRDGTFTTKGPLQATGDCMESKTAGM